MYEFEFTQFFIHERARQRLAEADRARLARLAASPRPSVRAQLAATLLALANRLDDTPCLGSAPDTAPTVSRRPA